MKLRVWKRKLMFANHLKSLNEEDLAAKIWKEQLTSDWPGLAKEVKKICEDLAIDDVTSRNYSKIELRRIINKACKDRDIKDIREGMERMSKLEVLKLGDYEAKPYLKMKSLGQVR